MKKLFDIAAVRANFPCLRSCQVFLDSAASSQKPQCVIDALVQAYTETYANVHRGMYSLSEISTAKFEATRAKVARFIGSKLAEEIVFTKGATEAINLVAHSYGNVALKGGDEIVVSTLEHHSNIVPWQQIAAAKGAKLRVAPITDECELDLEAFERMLNERTKIVAMTHVSNAVGTVVPIERVIELAHRAGAIVLVDASQSIVHQPINVRAMDADFLVFSGHKVYGPNGTGVLYGRSRLLELMVPYQTGGGMVDQVDFERATFLTPPGRFEAGTPAIAEVIALSAALDYVDQFDSQNIMRHEQHLHLELEAAISKHRNFKIIGRATGRAPITSFVHESAHASDVGTLLNQCGIAVRTGHHCAQPLMARLGLKATARASLAMYSNQADVRAFADALDKVSKLLG